MIEDGESQWWKERRDAGRGVPEVIDLPAPTVQGVLVQPNSARVHAERL